MMSVEALQLDPQNPRKISISRQEIMNGLNKADPNYEIKFNELESLKEVGRINKKSRN